MKESLSIFITVIVLVLLIVVFPLYNYFERQDDMSYNLVLKSTTEFIDDIRNCGYISQKMYTDYISQISNTGNLYDIQLEAYRKVLVRNDSGTEYNEQYLIDYDKDIFSNQVVNGSSSIDNKVIKNGVYHLNVGDKIFIKLKNSSTTMAGALFNVIVPTSSPETIKINYGGIVQNNTWKESETTLFEEFNFKLSFDLNTKGDNNANYNNSVLEKGIKATIYTGSNIAKVKIPDSTPSRPNCTFKGWSTTKDGSGKIYFAGDDIYLSDNFVLYAVWQYNDIPLTLNANGGSPQQQSKVLKYNGTYIALNQTTIPTMNGYTFDGWYTSSSGGTKMTVGTKVSSTNSVTLYAHWKKVQITITLNGNGGSVTPTKVTGLYKEIYGSLPTPARTGYTFDGWYLELSFRNRVTESTVIDTSTNHTLHAKWLANTYTITFDGNGGNSELRNMEYNSSLGTLPNSYRSGYNFEGWYTDRIGGIRISSDTKVVGNTTYYAHWTRKTTICQGIMRIQYATNTIYPYREETSDCCNARICRATSFVLACDNCGAVSNCTNPGGVDWCSSCGLWVASYSNNKAHMTSAYWKNVPVTSGICGRTIWSN